MKYIVVTGAVISGLGKGICSSSIGALLKAQGFHVTAVKIDPYLNVDAGTMSPYEHGEVYVLGDGTEADLDMGNYERFLDVNLTADHNITSGKVYQGVIQKERQGAYLGKTVQIVPHLRDEIKHRIEKAAHHIVEGRVPNICLIELGGTIGDIESEPFLCALRELDAISIMVSLVPSISGEPKTKPTQHGIQTLMSKGIVPSLLVARSQEQLAESVVGRLATKCRLPRDCIFCLPNARSLYTVPPSLHAQGMSQKLRQVLGYAATHTPRPLKWATWAQQEHDSDFPAIRIGIVGKYVGTQDAYLSVVKALIHGGMEHRCRVDITWITELRELQEQVWDGILIPGGFGDRGVQLKIDAVEFARTQQIPFFGICLGMQCAVIEFSRNVCGWQQAHSTEFQPKTSHPVVHIIEDDNKYMGGTMRLGNFYTEVQNGSLAYSLYKVHRVQERHRHRYEVNANYLSEWENLGLWCTGASIDRIEIVELHNHPFFLAVQFHPEFTSRPGRPNPCFSGFVQAALHLHQIRARKTTSRIQTPV